MKTYRILVSLLMVLSVSGVSTAKAEILEARVSVKGLSCPFCASGLERKFGSVEGVKDISISLKRGEAVLKYGPKASFKLEEITGAVQRGGFTTETVRIIVIGRILGKDGSRQFVSRHTGNVFALDEAKLPADMKERFQSAVRENNLVRVEGPISAAIREGAWPILQVTRLQDATNESSF